MVTVINWLLYESTVISWKLWYIKQKRQGPPIKQQGINNIPCPKWNVKQKKKQNKNNFVGRLEAQQSGGDRCLNYSTREPFIGLIWSFKNHQIICVYNKMIYQMDTKSYLIHIISKIKINVKSSIEQFDWWLQNY